MNILDQIKLDVGLVQEKQPVVVAPSSDMVIDQINEYLAADTLSNYIVQLEKSANIQVSDEIKSFVVSAEESGIDENEIVDFIFQKKGYQIPRESDSKHRELLHKAADHIIDLNTKLEVMDKNFELVKVAMDMVQSEHLAPFTSFDDLTEKIADLLKEGDPELLKKAAELLKKRLPVIGKVANNRQGVAMSATDRYLQELYRINQGE